MHTLFPATVLCSSILVLMLSLGAAWLVGSKSSFYAAQINAERSESRFHSIDGLRGLLATLVLFHHSIVNYYFYSTGQWALTPSKLANLMGQGGVAMFFMVTALLFSRHAFTNNGTMDFRRFFWSRIMRTVPMYFVAVTAVILTALALTHFRLQVSISEFAKSSSAWLLFTIPGVPDVNGFEQTRIINSVFWSLVYEWKFYLLFPILLLFARGVSTLLVLAICAILIHWYSTTSVEWYFVYGALTAVVLHRLPDLSKRLTGTAGSVAVVVLLVCIYVTSRTAYSPRVAPLFFLVFLVIASGNTLFGLLTSRAARMLGLISYSFYLTHAFVLYLMFRAINHFNAVNSLTVWVYMGFVLLAALITVCISGVTYRYVEHPFLIRRWKE